MAAGLGGLAASYQLYNYSIFENLIKLRDTRQNSAELKKGVEIGGPLPLFSSLYSPLSLVLPPSSLAPHPLRPRPDNPLLQPTGRLQSAG